MASHRVVPVLVSLALLISACGGSDDGDESSAASSTTAASVSTTSVQPATTAAPSTTATATTSTTSTVAPASELFTERGPNAVGVRTISLGDRDAEVWYPVAGDIDCETEIFDSLTVFPEEFQAFIPEELQSTRDTGTCRDAEILQGSYPVVVYSHGFGGYRQVFTDFTSHLASWGFIAVSTDHIERDIRAQSRASVAPADDDEDDAEAPEGPRQDVLDILNSVRAVGDDDELGAVADLDRVAVTGHSAGAFAAASAAADDLVDGYVTLTGALVDDPAAKPAMVISAELDMVVPAARSVELFDAIRDGDQTYYLDFARAGHNSFTDSCAQILLNGGLGALVDLIGEEQVERGEEGCTEDFADPTAVQAAVKHYITSFLMELFGDDRLSGSIEARDDLGVDFTVFEIGGS